MLEELRFLDRKAEGAGALLPPPAFCQMLERGQDERPLECLRQAPLPRRTGPGTATLGQFRAVLDQVRASDGDASETALDLRHNIGVLLLSQGKATEAAAVLRPLYDDLCLVLGRQDESAQEVADILARLRLAKG